jgi:hypothetical protein
MSLFVDGLHCGIVRLVIVDLLLYLCTPLACSLSVACLYLCDHDEALWMTISQKILRSSSLRKDRLLLIACVEKPLRSNRGDPIAIALFLLSDRQ